MRADQNQQTAEIAAVSKVMTRSAIFKVFMSNASVQ